MKKFDKEAFIRSIPVSGRMMDVGCGNNSPKWVKSFRPDLFYIGLDIEDYNQDSHSVECADEYILTSAEDFDIRIASYANSLDAIVSSHNLEHCNEPEKVLTAMMSALKPGGILYLAFPCEESVYFPRRAGGLNFYDDCSHQLVPNWDSTLKSIENGGGEITVSIKRNRPLSLALKGLLYEPWSRIRGHTYPGITWALYGFESIIWAKKSLSN